MPTDTGARLRRWLLPCVLSLSVIGMHHLAFAAAHCDPCETHTVSHVAVVSSSAGHSPLDPHADPPSPSPDSGHDLLHLCLAVLATAAGLLLGWLLLALAVPPAVPARTPFLRTTRRRRRRSDGRSILTLVRVLRI